MDPNVNSGCFWVVGLQVFSFFFDLPLASKMNMGTFFKQEKKKVTHFVFK